MLRNILKKRVCEYFLFFMVFSMTFPAYIFALPQGGNVVAGQAGISTPDPGNMHINQGTNKAIINWQSFSIAHPEAVRFFQPGSSSIALNRVIGVDPSAIYGSLTANGRIFLINTNGILVGPTGRINVNSFLASTLDIANEDFLSGSYIFSQTLGKSLSSIVNQGIITTAPGGFTSLLAPAVQNEGSIIASLGKVYIGAGEQVTLNFAGNDLINFVVDKDVTDEVLGPDGEPIDDTILNKGSISAEGGEVILSARTAYDAIKSVINNEGIIEAKSIVNENGVIKLVGGDKGIVKSSGTLDASGRSSLIPPSEGGTEGGLTGGTVQVLGEKVGLFDTAIIDVSGDLGGGTVLIGGDFQGKNPDIMNASRTYVGSDVSITADALTNGDGGKVIVWADDITRFYGDISARGGAQSGDGGFVEVSGKEWLSFRGKINVDALNGNSGSILFDPKDITIATAGDDTYLTATGVVFDSPDQETLVTFTVAGIQGLLGNITLQASRNILVSDALNLTNQGSGKTVLLEAGNNIDVQASITTADADISLTAAKGGWTYSSTSGTVTIGANLDAGAGNISISSGGATIFSNTPSITSNNFTIKASDITTLNNATLTNVTGVLTLEPDTDARTIGLGAGAAQNFNLDDTEIAKIQAAGASSVVIGRATQTGILTLSGAATFTGDTVTLNAGSFDDLEATTSIITATTLNLNATTGAIGAATTNDEIDIAVTDLSVNTAGGSNAYIKSAGGYNISAASSVGGGTLSLTAGGNITQGVSGVVTAGTLLLSNAAGSTDLSTAANAISALGAITSTGGNFTLNNKATGGTALSVTDTINALGANVELDTGTAAVTFTGTPAITATNFTIKASDITTLNNATLTNVTGVLTLEPDTDARTIGLGAGAAQNFNLDDTEIAKIQAAGASSVVIGRATQTGILTLSGAATFTGDTVTLNAGSFDDLEATTSIITATTLNLNATTGAIGAATTNDEIDIAVTDLSVNTAGGSNAYIKSAGGYNISAASSVGGGTLSLTAGGNITQGVSGVVTAGTLLLSNAAGSTDLSTAANAISALGAITSTGGNFTLNNKATGGTALSVTDTINALGANVELDTGTAAVTFTGTPAITATNFTIKASDITTLNNATLTNVTGVLTLEPDTDARTIGLGAGAAQNFNLDDTEIAKIQAAGASSVVIGRATQTGILTLSGAATFTGDTVTLNAGSFDDLEATTSIITATTLNLNATTGAIGAATTNDEIDIAVTDLSVNTAGGSNAYIKSAGGYNISAASSVGGGTLSLTAGGNITQGVSGVVTAGTLLLSNAAGSTDLSTAANAISALGAITSTGGNFTLNNKATGGTALSVTDTINALGANVELDTGTAAVTFTGTPAITATNFTIKASDITTLNNATLTNVTGVLTLEPDTDARTIGLGAGAAQNFNLDDTEIAKIQAAGASSVVIGRATQTGILTLSGAATFTGDTVTLNAGSFDDLEATTSIITATTLNLNATTGAIGAATTNDEIDIAVTDLSVNTAGGSNAYIKSAGGYNISAASSVGGGTLSLTAGGNITQGVSGVVTAGTLLLSNAAGSTDLSTAANAISALGAITSTGGNFTLNNKATGGTALSVTDTINALGANVELDTGTAAVTFTGTPAITATNFTIKASDITTLNNATLTNVTGVLTLEPDTDARTIGLGAGAAQNFNLDDTEIAKIQAAGASSVVIGRATQTGILTLSGAATFTGDTVTLNAGSFDDLEATTSIITATTLNLNATTGAIGAATTNDEIDIAVTDLSVNTAGGSNAYIKSAGGYNISAASSVGGGTLSLTAGGNITQGVSGVVTAGTLLLSNAAGSTDLSTAANAISALGAITSTGGNFTLNNKATGGTALSVTDTINALGANVELDTGTAAVTFTGTPAITATNFTIKASDITTLNNATLTNVTGVLTLEPDTDARTIGLGAGAAQNFNLDDTEIAKIQAAGASSVVIGRATQTGILTLSGAATFTGDTVTLNAGSFDDLEATTSIITATTLNLNATTGAIGAATTNDEIDIAVTDLSVNTAGGSNAYIKSAGGYNISAASSVGGGTLSLTAGGNITQGVSGVVTAGTLLLSNAAGSTDLSTAANAISALGAITSTGGNFTLNNKATGGTALSVTDTINALGANVELDTGTAAVTFTGTPAITATNFTIKASDITTLNNATLTNVTGVLTLEPDTDARTIGLGAGAAQNFNLDDTEIAKIQAAGASSVVIGRATQTGILTLSGAATFTGDTVTLNAGSFDDLEATTSIITATTLNLNATTGAIGAATTNDEIDIAVTDLSVNTAGGSNAYIKSAGGYNISAASSVGGGTLSLTAGGNITQGVSGVVTAGTLLLSNAAGSTDLSTAANAISALGAITSTGGNFTLNNKATGGTALSVTDTINALGANVELDTGTAAVTFTGTPAITATNFTIKASDITTLNNATLTNVTGVLTLEPDTDARTIGLGAGAAQNFNLDDTEIAKIQAAGASSVVIGRATQTGILTLSGAATFTGDTVTLNAGSFDDLEATTSIITATTLNLNATTGAIGAATTNDEIDIAVTDLSVNTAGGSNAYIKSAGGYNISAASSVGGGTLSLTAGGNITQGVSGVVTAGTLLLSNAAGSTDLSTAANAISALGAITSTGGNFTLNNKATGGTALSVTDTINALGANVELDTGTAAVTFTGTPAITATNFTIKASDITTLNNATLTNVTGVLTLEPDTDARTIGLGAGAAQNFNLDDTEIAKIQAAGASSVVIGRATQTGILTLSGAATFTGDTVTLNAGSFDDLEATTSIITATTLNLNATTGAIGAATTNDEIDIAVTDLSVNTAGGSNAYIKSAGGYNISAASSVGGGTLSLTAGGNITQGVSGVVTAGTLLLSNAAGSTDLSTAANAISALGAITSTGGNFTLNNKATGGTALSVTDTINALGANVELDTGTAAVTFTGTPAITATNFTIKASDITTLNNATLTNVTGVLTLEPDTDARTIGLGAGAAQNFNLDDTEIAKIQAAGASSVVIGRATQTGILTLSGAATFTGDTVTLNAGSFDDLEATTSIITATTLNLNATTGAIGAATTNDEIDIAVTDLSVNTAGGSNAYIKSAGGYNISAASSVGGGTLSLTAGGNITQGVSGVVTAGTLLLSNAAGSTDLSTAANAISALGAITSTGGNFTLNNKATGGTALSVTDTINALGANVELDTGTAAVTFTGTPAITATNFTIKASDITTLNNATLTNVTGVLTLEPDTDARTIGLGAGAAQNFNLDDTEIAKIQAAGASSVVIGRATQTGILTLSGAATFTGDTVTLNAGSFDDLEATTSIITATTLNLNATTGAIGAATTNDEIDIAVTDLSVNTAGGSNAYIKSAGGYNISAASSVGGGTLSLTAGGNITQGVSGVVTAGTLLLSNAAGSTDLSTAANAISALGAITSTGGNFTLNNKATGGTALSVTDTINALGANVELDTGTAAVTFTGTPAITATNFTIKASDITTLNNATLTNVTGVLTLEPDTDARTIGLGAGAAQNFNLDDTEIAKIQAAGASSVVIGRATQTGILTLSGAATFTGDTVTLNAGSFDDLEATTSIITATTLNLNATTGAIGAATTNDEIDIAVTDLSVNTAGGSNAYIKSAGGYNISAASSVGGGTLSLTAGGNITDDGAAITAGTVTIAAGAANDITLDTAANDFGTVVITSGNNVTLVDANAVILGAHTVAGNLSWTAGGAITNSGALAITGTTTISNVGNHVTLNNAANDFTGAVSVDGKDVTLVDANAIELGASTVTGTYDVTATAGGDITNTGALTITGAATFTAADGQSISVANAGNSFSSTVAFVASAGTLANVTVLDTTALDLQALTVGTNLTATGAGLTQSGALIVPGTATFTSTGGANDITLSTSTNDFGTVVATSANDATFVDTNAVILGAHDITGDLSWTAAGITLDADISAGTTLTLDAGTSNITGAGQFTSGGRTDILASLIGDSSSYDLSPMANVVGDNLYMTLTGGKGAVSGRLRRGAKMSSAPPKTNFVSEGYIYIKGFPMYSPREGVDVEAILAAIATLSSQQEKMEAMLFSAAAGAGEFFMTEPVWLDFGLEMIYEGLENLPVDQWDEMMRLWEERYKKLRSLNFTPNSLQINTQAVNSYEYNANFERLSVMQWDEIMRNYLSANSLN